MLTQLVHKLLLAGLAVTVAGMPGAAHACGLFDWLCGRPRGAVVSQTTYAPPYCGPAAVSTVGYAGPATACATPAVSYSAAQTCHYVPETRYRPPARPLLTALFGPQVEQQYDPCTGCTVTTTGPRRWSLFGRTVPTTTYRMVCSPMVAPPVTYSPVVTGVSSMSSVGVSSVPIADCAPALPPAQTYVAPEPAPYAPYTAPQPTPYTTPEPAATEDTADAVPRTFAPAAPQQTRRPEPDRDEEALEPVPDGNTRLNSAPAPLLIDPDNRTTRYPIPSAEPAAEFAVRQAAYRSEAAAPGAPRLVEVQWQPASR